MLHAAQMQQVTDAYTNRVRGEAVVTVSSAVSRFFRDTGTYPVSLNALSQTAGHEQVRSSILPWQSYATTSALNDGVWQFSRAVVFTQDTGSMVTAANYLAASNNACGSAAFATAPDWCGPNAKGTYFWRHESREIATIEMARERQRLRRVLDKFARYFNETASFPNPGSAASTLPAIVSYAGVATNCTGMTVWTGIPIDCSDLYSNWGTPTTYNYISDSHIVLLTKTPFLDNTGNYIYISLEFAL